MHRISDLIVVMMLGSAGLACGSEQKPVAINPSGGGAGGGLTVSARGGAGGGVRCKKTPYPQLEITTTDCVQVGTVKGQILDQDGRPPTANVITVCGDACMYGELEADGTFSMAVDHCYNPSVFYSVPVFIYHGWPDYADVTVKIVPDGATDLPMADVGVITTVTTETMKNYRYADPIASTFTDDKLFALQVSDCQLKLPAFENEVYVGEIAIDHFPLPNTPANLLSLYFVGPDNSYFTEPAMVRFPNSAQLEPGTAVELMALGNMGTTTVIEAGTWATVGTGRVSANGQFIESDPSNDSGLHSLGWIGYRKSP